MGTDKPTTEALTVADLGLSSEILVGQNRVLGLIAGGAHQSQILDEFCRVLAEAVPEACCCVMIARAGDHSLHVGAAPGLPPAVRGALDGITIGLAPGSCSAAAHRNEVVISGDLVTDPLWEGMRQQVLDAGLRACWSAPIRSMSWASSAEEEDELRVLGTVAFYYPSERRPTGEELELLEMASSLAGLALTTARAHAKIGEQRLYDGLSGLPNRRLFTEQLRETVAQLNPREDKIGILLLDLDHFKDVNDTFGYAVGDFLLRSVAKRLVGCRQSTDLLARFGDDEFVFLIHKPIGDQDFKEIAASILAAVAEPHDFGGHQLAVTASVGLSLYPWDGEDAQTLLRNAESALKAAKRQGRNRLRLYAPTMGVNAFEKLQLKMALTYAAENQELELLYQPKIRSQDGRIVGVEALCYWNHPTHGRVSPGRFIPLAEETGLILPIGSWVLRTACAQIKAWRSEGFQDFTVAVNISAHQFRERNFVDAVAGALDQTGLEPQGLELEITETVAMTEVERTMERLTALHELGLRTSIDDFGTGYSSLAYLKRFPIHTLKIDRSFVHNLPEDRENRAIVKAVIALSHYLGIDLVAEGVETPEQAAFLRREGCHYLQGFHFSRPVEAHRLAMLLRAGRRASQPGSTFMEVPAAASE